MLSRSEINLTKSKAIKQKGTGRARVVTGASPIWRGGGKVFPSSVNENFKKKIKTLLFFTGGNASFFKNKLAFPRMSEVYLPAAPSPPPIRT